MATTEFFTELWMAAPDLTAAAVLAVVLDLGADELDPEVVGVEPAGVAPPVGEPVGAGPVGGAPEAPLICA